MFTLVIFMKVDNIWNDFENWSGPSTGLDPNIS